MEAATTDRPENQSDGRRLALDKMRIDRFYLLFPRNPTRHTLYQRPVAGTAAEIFLLVRSRA